MKKCEKKLNKQTNKKPKKLETSEKVFQKVTNYNISHKLLRPNQFLKIFLEFLEWSTLQK